MKRKAYFALCCIALIFATVAAKVTFGADPRVETVDAAGQRQTYVPQTQSSDTAPLPRVEILDIDGARKIFIPQPTTRPTVLYAELGGIPAGAVATAAGDVCKMRGDVLLTNSSGYTASGGDVVARLWAQQPGTVIQVLPGKQVTIRASQAGVTYDGKGKGGKANSKGQADDNNDNAMVLVEDDVHLHTFRVTAAQGVGCNIVGKHVVSWLPEWDHNGAQGRGAHTRGDDGVPGSAYLEFDGSYHDNNQLGLTNAGNKYTRSSYIMLVRPHFYRECGGDLWADNYNEFIDVIDAVFEVGPRDKKGNPHFAFRSELGLPGGTRLIRPVFKDGINTCLSIDESSNVTVTDPTFGKCDIAIVLRNMLRKDDKTGKWKGNRPVDEKAFTCRLWNFNLTGAIYLPGAGAIEPSNALVPGVRVSQSNNRLSFGPPRAGKQVVKVAN